MMIVHKIISAILFSIFLFSSAQASEGLWAKNIDAILEQNGLSKDQYGIEIRDIGGTQIFYSENPAKSFNPASTLKILISVIALEKFGINYKFQTLVKKQGKDLCLVGQGDPSLVYEDLFLMTESLLRNPDFAGSVENILVDESFFPTTRQYDEGFDGDSQRSFTAPLSSLSLNYNSVTVFVKPGTIGSQAMVYTEPRSSYFNISNQTRTVKSGEKNIQVNINPGKDKIEISVSGSMPAFAPELIAYRAVTEPSLYAGAIFKDMLERTGVSVSGKIQKKSCNSSAENLVTYQSKPLNQIVQGMNKFSNNFIAESLLYHLGDQPTSQSGLDAMISWSRKQKLPMNGVKIENASGLSRSNVVTPLFLWSVLSWGRNTFQISPEFMASLPVGGVDGTLKRRFHGDTENLVRAKSGSLKNTVSLAGSLQTSKKGELLFVFLFETKAKTLPQIQAIEEKILEKVAALGEKN